MATTPTPQQSNVWSLLSPTAGAVTSLSDPQSSALRRLLALLRLATSAGQYKFGSTPTLGALGGAGNLAGGLLGAVESPTATGKASGAAGAALGGTQLAASAGVPAAQAALPYAHPALAGVGLGLSLADIARNKNLSTTQKAGHSSEAGFFAGTSFIPVAGQIMAAAKALEAVGGHLEGSKSPQVRGTGRALSQVATPSGEKAFWDVARGDRSPAAAIRARGGFEGGMIDTMGPIGAILKGVGVNLPFLHHDPTTGTLFRGELDRLFNQIPTLKGTPTNQYNIDPNVYNALPQNARDTASMLGTKLSALAPDAKKNPQAYANQVSAILLNKYGAGLPGMAPDILKLLGG